MKKSQAIGTRINSNMFDYVSDSKTFVTDVSQLSHSRLDPLSQLYHDACDEGFVMVSAKSGDEVEFYMDEVLHHGEDIGGWRFKPTTAAVWWNPKLADVSVSIFNT